MQWSLLFTASLDTTLRSWNIETGAASTVFNEGAAPSAHWVSGDCLAGHTAGLTAVCTLKASELICTCGRDLTVLLWCVSCGVKWLSVRDAGRYKEGVQSGD